MLPIYRKTIIFLTFVLAITGCGAHRLYQAQDIFNDSARIESQVSFEDIQATGDPLTGNVQALQGYRSALSLTNEALEKYTKSLKEDQLYGTALMLKVLCQWRIASLDEQANPKQVSALVTQIEAKVKNKEVILGTRDQVLLAALPGLYEHELGLMQHDRKKAIKLFESARDTMEIALKQVNPPEDHPIRTYIRLSQMNSLRAQRWVSLPDAPQNARDKKKWHDEWNDKYKIYRSALVPLMLSNPGLKKRVEIMDGHFGYIAQ